MHINADQNQFSDVKDQVQTCLHRWMLVLKLQIGHLSRRRVPMKTREKWSSSLWCGRSSNVQQAAGRVQPNQQSSFSALGRRSFLLFLSVLITLNRPWGGGFKETLSEATCCTGHIRPGSSAKQSIFSGRGWARSTPQPQGTHHRRHKGPPQAYSLA